MQVKIIPSINITYMRICFKMLITNIKSKYIYNDCRGSIFNFLQYFLHDSVSHPHHNSNNSLCSLKPVLL
jgi:hypothetical protein